MRRFLKHSKPVALQAKKAPRSPRLRDFRFVAALCGCLLILGVISSAVFARWPGARVPTALIRSVPAPACCGRRRNRKATDAVLNQDVAASYARYSSDQQDAKSIVDQQRPCCDRAERDGKNIPDELQFVDEAVSGTKLQRDGFDRMLKAAEEGRFKTLYFFDLSRLARESVITITTLKKLVYVYKVRVVSVSEGIDSANEGWFALATLLGLQHEQYLKTLSANVLRGLIGNLFQDLSLGDLSFGYSSVPVPGAPLRGRGSRARPPKKYVIAEDEANWVRKVFLWYAKERQPIQWIVRELNRNNVPKDHRSGTQKWGRAGVRALLRRIKYLGIWPWGLTKNCRNPLTGQITKEMRSEEETQDWIRRFPELQIIDEETFAEAQRRLDKNEDDCEQFRDNEGKLSGSRGGALAPRHLLQGRVRCAKCGSAFYVGGARGKYLICPAFRNGICECRTMLPRELAQRMILEEVGGRMLADLAWRQSVHDYARRAWDAYGSTAPSELESAEKQLGEIERRIDRLVDQIEDGLDDANVKQRLADRRREKEATLRDINKLRNATQSRPPEPTPEWIDEQLGNLHKVLTSGTPAAAIALGNLVGDVVVSEVSRPGRKRPFLRGEFGLRARSVVNDINGSAGLESLNNLAEHGADEEKIALDFVEADPKYEQSDLVKQLRDNCSANWEIAEQLGVSYSRVTYLWRFWYERRGLAVPELGDRPKRKRRETPLYKQISEVAKQRWEQGASESEIGRDFKTTQATVREAITWWHESRNLPKPRFKDRRQTQAELAGNMREAGCTLAEISAKLKRTITTVRKLLDEWHAAKGEVRPDGRTERHRRKRSA